MRKHYHFIGIGGIGMSAIARILLKKGEKVSGSDLKESPTLKSLQLEGAEISIGHSSKNIKRPDGVIFSTEVPSDNEELAFARKKGIPILHRSELLASLLEGYAPLLVAGTHGKTTTSSLLSHVLVEAGVDPCYAVGGYLNGVNSNGRFGKGVYFALEADESDGSFLRYASFGGILTNLEHDHMEYWKTEEALLEAFKTFGSKIGSKEHLFWCKDDMLLKSLKLKGYSYGFDERADLTIDNFCQVQWKMVFDITFEGKHYREIESPLIGAHNVQNAAAVFGLGLKLDISENLLREGIRSFRGVGRRVELKGEKLGIEVYDDYAHHPTEIFATLRAVRSATHGKKRIIVAFQPHRYSRTKYCMDDFADAFEYADHVILTDIYGAREQPIPGVTSENLVKRIKSAGFKNIDFIERGKLSAHLAQALKSGDLLITMGAGDITNVGPAILNTLKEA